MDKELERFVKIVKQELGKDITLTFAALLFADIRAFYPKLSMPVWMVAYLRLSRLNNRPYDPTQAAPVYLFAIVGRPYRKLNERRVYAGSLSFVTPI